jgi:hypothetical protein
VTRTALPPPRHAGQLRMPVYPQLLQPSSSSLQRLHAHSVRPVPAHMGHTSLGSSSPSRSDLSSLLGPSTEFGDSRSIAPVAMKPPMMTPAATPCCTNHSASPTCADVTTPARERRPQQGPPPPPRVLPPRGDMVPPEPLAPPPDLFCLAAAFVLPATAGRQSGDVQAAADMFKCGERGRRRV